MPVTKGISGFDLEPAATSPRQRRNRVLLIGIDDYEHWGKLEYPVKDCGSLFQVLKEHYGFQEHDLIQSLYNEQATADIIFDELYRLQEQDEDGKPRLGPDDNLILYFSGHGHLDKSLDEGYWAPVDAPVPVKNRPSDLRKLVSVSEVVKILSQVKAHHVLLIVDACFSGAFARVAVEVMPGGDPNNPEEKPSRWVLTAGRLEPVPDRSEFAEALRQVLEANDSPKVSIDWVGAEVAKKVRENTHYNPWCGSLVEQKYEGGEFFFHRRTAVQRTDQALRPAAAMANLPERLRQGSAAHLERLKKGRFKHLNIIQLLLTGNNLPGLIDTSVKSGNAETPLQQAVAALWGREKPHAVVLGDGGMGKTVSLVRLWQDMLGQQSSTIPVFVALNEYNAIPESEKHDFVLRSIARNCGLAEALTDDWKNALWELLKTPLPDGSPSVLLLLDGFNEVTVKKDQLLIDLNRLSEQAKGMQMVITSRYVEIQNFTWAQRTEVIELLPLPPDKIAEYLQQVNLPLPEDEALQKLFGNPMMLTLYAGASSIAKKYENDKRFRFLPTGSYGELLWNFNEAQLARHLEDLEHDPNEQVWHCFLLRCLVPRLACKMELEGQFFVPTRKALNPSFNFKTLLDEAFTDLNREELTEVFPELHGKRSLLGLGELADLDAREQRSQRVLKYLVDKLHLLVAEDEALRFVHQNFRDFFAAVHLRNVAEMALVRGELPEEWKVRAFPVYLRRMIGEMEGEQYKKPYHDNYLKIEDPNNLLSKLINCSRGVFSLEKTGLLIWNTLTIAKDIRRSLCGMDLSYLNLENFLFNGVRLSARWKHHVLTPVLRGCKINGEQFVFKGHIRPVNHASYSTDGKKIISASWDGTIKEWSAETGVCLNTFYGHQSWVHCVHYSMDNKKVLSASADGTIREWNSMTGQPIRIYEIGSLVNSACYNREEDKILSASNDCRIIEWSTKNGRMCKSYIGHSRGVKKAIYSKDYKHILSASFDKTLKYWDVENDKCITLNGHQDYIRDITISPNGEKAVSSSWDNELRIWCLLTGNCLQVLRGNEGDFTYVSFSPDGSRLLTTWSQNIVREYSTTNFSLVKSYIGHKGIIRSIFYRPDGRHFLSSSADCTAKEWSTETGECLQTLFGSSNDPNSIDYSPDGKKILISYVDGEIEEWGLKYQICVSKILEQDIRGLSFMYIGKGDNIYYHNSFNQILARPIDYRANEIIIYQTENEIQNICFDNIGNRAFILEDNLIIEWDIISRLVNPLSCSTNATIKRIEYSPSKNQVVVLTELNELLLFATTPWHKTNHLSPQNFCIIGMKRLPQEEKLLFFSAKKVFVWELKANECLCVVDVAEIEKNLPDSFESLNLRDLLINSNGTKALLCFDRDYFFEIDLNSLSTKRIDVGYFSRILYATFTITGVLKKGDLIILYPNGLYNVATEFKVNFTHETGIITQGCDFRHLHPSSHFTKEEKERLRRYGAIFSDEDERRWKEAVADAYGDLEDDEPENLPQP